MSRVRTLEDDDRCGRMATTVTPENISRVDSLIKKDPKMAYAEIQDIMKISSGSLTRILHDCLGVRKRCARWVPYNLSEEQKQGRVDWCTHMLRKFDGGRSPSVRDIVAGSATWVYQYDPETKQQSAVWVFPDENPPVKFNRNKSASKQMIACFFANFRRIATIQLENRKTVTADWYISHCLPKSFQAWCKWRPQMDVRGLLLHHDNASADTAAATLDFLVANDVQLVTHPPYSPDLAPFDCFFPFRQKAAEGKAVSERRRCPSIHRGRHF